FISSWFAAIYLAKPEDYVPDMSRGLTLVFGIAFIIMALVSLFGIIGSLFNRQYEVDNCIQHLQKQQDSNAISESLQTNTEICTHNETMLIVRNVIIAILLILFSTLFARVSSSYAQQLEKKSSRRGKITPAPGLPPTVASYTTIDYPS
ncbi:281_t:CDS:2, partial [Racocetra persica]